MILKYNLQTTPYKVYCLTFCPFRKDGVYIHSKECEKCKFYRGKLLGHNIICGYPNIKKKDYPELYKMAKRMLRKSK